MSAAPSGGGSAHAIRWRVLPADLLTPVGAYLRLAALDGSDPGGRANRFLLESIEGGATRGRYSVIGVAPDLVWRCRDGQVAVARDDGVFRPEAEAPLASLRALLAAHRIGASARGDLPPMVGALVGYLGYDMVREMETLPAHATDDLAIADAVLLRPTLYAVFDNVRDELTLAAPVWAGEGGSHGGADAAEARLDRAAALLDGPLPEAAVTGADDEASAPVSNCTEQAFVAIVERCRGLIEAGDVFQVVPSQRFSAPFSLPPVSLYRALRRINPAPFLYCLELHDGTAPFALVGSSPEVLVRVRDGVVTIRPLAGTRRRGHDRAEDLALEQELLADPKERAEHLMLVDLGRNDVGRVAELGSVRVTESFAVERYSHVMHISSTVEGRLRAACDAVDALVAGFPAGTLSGAPKIRAMEIIAEVEPTKRGFYGGCIGYFAPDGTMDTCIGLRTALIKDGTMHVQAGCGVVADSVAALEFEETRQKARALFRAADEARRIASRGRNEAGIGRDDDLAGRVTGSA